MSRQQLSVVIGLLTGHPGLNGHLDKFGKDIILYAEGVWTAMKLLNTLTMSRGRIFWQSFGELQQLSHVPVDLFRRFATEIGLTWK